MGLAAVVVVSSTHHHPTLPHGEADLPSAFQHADLEVTSAGQLLRVKGDDGSVAISSDEDSDWVLCKHFVKTEPRRSNCGYRACPVECGNCTEDDQCQVGFYCSKTLRKCVDGVDMECLEPTAHCGPSGGSCGQAFDAKTWVQIPSFCWQASKQAIRGSFTVVLSDGLDAGKVAASSLSEEALQMTLRELAGVAYESRWIAVALSCTEALAKESPRKLLVRYQLPIPGPARNPADGQQVHGRLASRTVSELQQLLIAKFGHNKLLGEGQTLHASDIRVLPYSNTSMAL